MFTSICRLGIMNESVSHLAFTGKTYYKYGNSLTAAPREYLCHYNLRRHGRV